MKPKLPVVSKRTITSQSVPKRKLSPEVIVSLTTWKGRICHENFPLNLYSLLTQNTVYDYKVVLVLSTEEFGPDFELPPVIQLYLNTMKHFEVLYTYRNTKALKNYNPTAEKYPATPIIVLGVDTIYSPDLVQRVYTDYLHSDRRTCLAARVSSFHSGLKVPWRLRIFPPQSMKYIPEDYFMQYFHDNNDLFYGVRLLLNRRTCVQMNWDGLWLDGSSFSQENRLTEYHKYNDDEVFHEFMDEHPEFW